MWPNVKIENELIGFANYQGPTELARLHGHDEAAELLERPSSKRPSRRRSSSGK